MSYPRPNCSDRAEEWSTELLPKSPVQLRRRKARELCAGCPIGLARCASYAVAEVDRFTVGMVWAGVPVPTTYSTAAFRAAVAELRFIAAAGEAVPHAV
jgi:hypothetical protein